MYSQHRHVVCAALPTVQKCVHKNGTYCKLYCVRFARFNKRKSVSQSVDTVMDIGHVGNSRHRIRLYVL